MGAGIVRYMSYCVLEFLAVASTFKSAT